MMKSLMPAVVAMVFTAPVRAQNAKDKLQVILVDQEKQFLWEAMKAKTSRCSRNTLPTTT
jgi:hypothetical protein